MDIVLKDFGAVGDGKTLNTAVIQNAIELCHENGGGKVIFSGGTYMSGTLVLKSNVELFLAADGKLLGSPSCDDYPERTDVHHVESAMLPRARNACLIYAEEAENIAIGGMGVIDCNGESFVRKTSEQEQKGSGKWAYVRIDAPTPPRVVFFAGCRNVRVTDVTMVNQPSGWSYWIHDCDYVSFDRCRVLAELKYPNNDGIHINSSRNVTVSNCMLTCGDDCIIVRANNASLPENKVCEKVTVTNCTLTSNAFGIRLGWIGDGVVRDCTFSNIVMTDCSSGIGIKLPGRSEPTRLFDEGREATLIENIGFHNIIMDRVKCYPIYMMISKKPVTRCIAIRNIYFDGIHARCGCMPKMKGRKENPIENVYFANCSFSYMKMPEDDIFRRTAIDDDPLDDIVFRMEMVKNCSLQNTTFSTEQNI